MRLLVVAPCDPRACSSCMLRRFVLLPLSVFPGSPVRSMSAMTQGTTCCPHTGLRFQMSGTEIAAEAASLVEVLDSAVEAIARGEAEAGDAMGAWTAACDQSSVPAPT